MQAGINSTQGEIEADFSSIPTVRSSYDAFLAHPRWNEICFEYVKGTLAAFALHPQMAKLVSTDARRHACNAIIARYYRKLLERGMDGLTLSEVHEAGLEGSLIGSRNRITGLIKIMQYAGFATVSVSESDARQRVFSLTEKGDFTARQFRYAILQPVDNALGTEYLKSLDESREHLVRFYERSVELFVTAGFSEGVFARYGTLLDVTSGPETLNSLYMLSEGGERENLVVPVGYLAKQRGVSRAQMRRIMQDCLELGLVEASGLGGREITILPALRELVPKLSAMRCAIVDRAAKDVLGI